MTDRVLALDLSAHLIGWAVVDEGPRCGATGTITLPIRRQVNNAKEARAVWNTRRFATLRAEVTHLVSHYQPSILAYEYPDKPRSRYSGGNKGREFHAMQGLGLAEGLLVACVEAIIYPPVKLLAITTSEAKFAVTGLHGASKERVRKDLARRFRMDVAAQLDGAYLTTDDETDAIAVAIAAHRAQEEADLKARLREAAAASKKPRRKAA